jgi:hypothetical protein
MRFTLIGLVMLLGLTEAGRKRKQAFETEQVGLPAQSSRGATSSSPPAVSAPRATSTTFPDEPIVLFRPVTQVDLQLLRILTSGTDREIPDAVGAAERFLGSGSRKIIIDWMDFCLFPLRMHAVRPLERQPCKVADNGLLTLDDRFAIALRAKIEESWYRPVASLNPTEPIRNLVWEVLKLYPDGELAEIEAAIQSVIPGAVVKSELVEPLRQKLFFLTRIPLWLHLVEVATTNDRSWASVQMREEAIAKYAQESGKTVVEVGRIGVSWGMLCVEPLFAWYNNPIGPMPCSIDDSGETVGLSLSGRRHFHL